MNTNEKQDFYNEVETDEINAVIEPIADDDMNIGMEDGVHLIGAEVFGDDVMDDIAPDAFVMDVDSDGMFDFDIADYGNDGLIDDVEILDIDSLDNIGDDDAVVMDVDSDGDFDFAIADVNNDGFIDTGDILDTLDDASSSGYIGFEEATALEDDPTLAAIEAEPESEEFDWNIEENNGPEIIETTEDLYPDDSEIEFMDEGFLDI